MAEARATATCSQYMLTSFSSHNLSYAAVFLRVPTRITSNAATERSMGWSDGEQRWDIAHLSEVGSVSLTGGLGGSDLVSSSRTSGSSESNVGSGTSNLVGLGVGLDLGDRDTSVGVGVNVDNLGVGESGVLVGVDVEQVSLFVSGRLGYTGQEESKRTECGARSVYA
jgi:hypothetical protein